MPHERIQAICLAVVLLVGLGYWLLCDRGGPEP